jgi:hypothetical protein
MAGMDRREDVGSKVQASVLGGLLIFALTSFIGAAWTTANEGKNKAIEIGERVTAIETRFSAIQGDLGEIKELLKRRIPGG